LQEKRAGDESQMAEKPLTIGDKVCILGNAKGRCWEYGFIADIENGEALINYGDAITYIFGMGIRKPLSQLEKVN